MGARFPSLPSLAGLLALTALAAVVVIAAAAEPVRAQGAPPPDRARVHPELVDPTWGPRMQAAWRLAWAGDWRAAEDAFAALGRERPDAMEPHVGRAFVARGEMRYRTARAHYRQALQREPTAADVRRQADALEWVRPGAVEVMAGRAGASTVTSDLVSVDVAAPVSPRLTLLARGGSIAGGDPLRASASGRLDSTAAVLLGAGAVVRLTDGVWLTPRLERWSALGETTLHGWLDGAWRAAGRVTLLATTRALNGGGAPPIVGAGAEMAVTRSGDVLTMYGLHGLRPDPRESRNQFRAFLTGAVSRRVLYRVGGVVERGDPISATTIAGGVTFFPDPALGVRTELSQRTGFAAQHSTLVGLVVRW